MGMLSNPGRALCDTLFGAGSVTDFKPKTWSSIDAYGDDSLGPIHYRGEGKVVWAVPESKMFNFFGFEFASADRMTLVGVDGCILVRAGAAPQGAAVAPSPPPRSAASPPVPTRPAIGYAPVDPRSALGRGMALYCDKDFQPALQQLLAATAANANDARGWMFLADTYRWLGLEREGEAARTQALKLDPNAPNLLR